LYECQVEFSIGKRATNGYEAAKRLENSLSNHTIVYHDSSQSIDMEL